MDIYAVAEERDDTPPEEEQPQRALEPHGVDVVEEDEAQARAEEDGREEDADELFFWGGGYECGFMVVDVECLDMK